MSYENATKQHMKFLEGFLEHKTKDKWENYWCVLRDKIIYLFISNVTTQDNHIGTLEINVDTRFIYDKKESFKFELKTSRHLNKFKARKSSERELWRAYIIGISTGSIPTDLDLLPGQIKTIEDEIYRFHQVRGQQSNRHSTISESSLTSGFSDGTIDGIFPDPEYTKMSRPGGRDDYVKPRFYSDPYSHGTPSWYFSNCDRALAEKILTGSPQCGNTLMRKSMTYEGSFTITKKKPTQGEFEHFEVRKESHGFKINAVNSPDEFCCLSDVMEHFIKLSGASVAKPFATKENRMSQEVPKYDVKIGQGPVDAENGEENKMTNVNPQYTDGSKTMPSRNFMSSFKDHSGTEHKLKQSRPGIDTRDININPYHRQRRGSDSYPAQTPPLPPVPPITVPHPHSRQKRSQSVPHIEGFLPSAQKGRHDINQLVPVSSDPGVVRKVPSTPHNHQPPTDADPYHRHLRQPSSSTEDANDPYHRQLSNTPDADDPYRRQQSKTAESPYDPYNRQQSNTTDVDDPYRRQQSKTAESPNDPYNRQQSNTTDVDDPYHRQHSKTAESPYDPYNRQQSNITDADDPNHRQHSMTAENPKHHHSTNDNEYIDPISPVAFHPPTSGSQSDVTPPSEVTSPGLCPSAIQAQLKNLKRVVVPTSTTKTPPPPVAPKTPKSPTAAVTSPQEVPSDDNSSSGSARDVNSNSTSRVIDGGMDKKELRKKLEMMMSQGQGVTTPPAPKPKPTSCRDLPLPPIPVEPAEELYEEIPAYVNM